MAADSDIENMRRIPVFSAIEPEGLRALSFRAETRLMRAGDVLFRKGEVADGGFVLVTGSIALRLHDEVGPADKIVKPWALVGEIALVAQTTRPVTAIALEPTTVLKISRSLFHHVLEQYPASAARVRQFFKKRLAEFSQRLKAEA